MFQERGDRSEVSEMDVLRVEHFYCFLFCALKYSSVQLCTAIFYNITHFHSHIVPTKDGDNMYRNRQTSRQGEAVEQKENT